MADILPCRDPTRQAWSAPGRHTTATQGTTAWAAVTPCHRVKRSIANRLMIEVEDFVEQIPRAIPTHRPNWWRRNWKWFVPAGCFTVVLMFVVFVGSILVIVFSAM